MGHINIPIFIPHLGCPNQCIFCNQRYISGTIEFKEADVERQIEQALSTYAGNDAEIAFFGGSFTGIDRDLMIRLLDIAQGYVNSKRVSAIRMSTRPDYINEEILDILSRYTISCVELGLQSINDEVLKYLKRGHTAEQAKNAIELLKKRKIPFVGQMMVGLPKATFEDEINCARFICENGACACRIYPTIVFRQTELADIAQSGGYEPLSLEDAVLRSAKVLKIFVDNGVYCLRIGLCESDNLHSSDSYVAGPNHPSIGEMVKSRLYLDVILERLNNLIEPSKRIIISCPKGATSQVTGNKRKNILYLMELYGFQEIKICENETLDAYDIRIFNKED